ncbi:hypothetical protein M1563_01070 [Patescibacteria group bacterium]|nr:hypothetical protein [Patescibacteria group bacterium]MCL5410178.1 hypothetical protein [Patescibacteria group bacterium]
MPRLSKVVAFLILCCVSFTNPFPVLAAGDVDTAFGPIPTDPTGFVQTILKFAIAVGGGVALILMALGAIQMITSTGNPEAVKKGQEQFTSAIIGLLFIIFSVMLLQIIGVSILNIPGFTP